MANAVKKAMLFLGLTEEEQPVAEQKAAALKTPQARQQHTAGTGEQLASVTPLHRVTPTVAMPQQQLNEILTVHPMHYSEAPLIAENFRLGIPIIINLSRMNDTDSKRMIDFASGLILGLNGHFERITGKVFLLTPAHIAIGEPVDEAPHNDSGSFFIAPATE